MTTFHVDSEAGRPRQVILHRPGPGPRCMSCPIEREPAD